jgi:hypothetical protein
MLGPSGRSTDRQREDGERSTGGSRRDVSRYRSHGRGRRSWRREEKAEGQAEEAPSKGLHRLHRLFDMLDLQHMQSLLSLHADGSAIDLQPQR